MSEPADKPLHDWVRQSLAGYQPEYDPDNWAKLRRTLRRRWWQRRSLWVVAFLLIGFLGWLVIPSTLKRLSTKPISSRSQPKEKVIPRDKSIPESFPAAPPLPRTASRTNTKRDVSTHYVYSSAINVKLALPTALVLPVLPIAQLSTQLTERIPQRYPVGFSPEEASIAKQVLTTSFGSDSTSYQVLTRNLRKWPNAVIVCDLTTSMYPYSTQLFAWFKQHARHPSIKGMVFFTDCDSLGHQTQPGGLPGQMFVTRSDDPTQVLPTLLAAARNTVHNNDDAENDVEALVYAQTNFPEANALILVADNISRVKDIDLVSKVKKPVHVILCGTTGSDTTLAYQPDYFTIAKQTNGSLHTLDDDINPTALTSSTTMRVGSRFFRYLPRKQRFKPTTFEHRPKRFLKFVWF